MKQNYKYKKAIKVLIKNDFEGSNIVAYHGTSVEAIEMLAKTGKLLGTDSEHQSKSEIKIPSGFVYITPLKEKFKDSPLYEKLKELGGGKIWSSQECYAETKAFTHYLTKNLGFLSSASLVDLSMQDERDSIGYKKELTKLIKEAKRHNITERNLRTLFESAFGRKGVGVGLSDKILELPTEHDPEVLGGALRIPVKTGLPIKYIGAIWPISKIDRQELNNFLN